MRTADPAAVRQRAAMLSAQFVTVNIRVNAMMQQGDPLTGEQIEEIFRRALEEELSRLLNDAYSNESWSDPVPDVAADIAEVCRTWRRPNRPMSPRASRRDEPPIGGNSHLDGPKFYAAQFLPNLADEQVAALLKALGIFVHPGLIGPGAAAFGPVAEWQVLARA
ncbi:hypothetical protein [Sphingomonas sp. R647]|uniref:hypothetical protein n=1 Tax=Sphingomonas sp. R647 TaxID=2875233 RepID=UPI001CD72262|nr:hypothetical protein [Sphingomonas sp. R647]